MSRSFDATILARRGPLFLMDLVFNTPSVRGPGLRDTSPPSNSNNISPLPLTKFENLRHEQEYENFFTILIIVVLNILDTLVWNHSDL